MGGASDPPSELCPWIPGCDFAGVVEQAGAQSEWKAGDEVFGIRAFGSTEGESPPRALSPGMTVLHEHADHLCHDPLLC